MNLIIKRTDSKDYSKFIKYLLNIIEDTGIKNISKIRCNAWDNYFNEAYKLKDFSTYNLLIEGFRNLRFISYIDKYLIEIDSTAKYDNKSLLLLCATVNNGTLSNAPYAIFDNTFNAIKKNIKEIYLMYRLKGQK